MALCRAYEHDVADIDEAVAVFDFRHKGHKGMSPVIHMLLVPSHQTRWRTTVWEPEAH